MANQSSETAETKLKSAYVAICLFIFPVLSSKNLYAYSNNIQTTTACFLKYSVWCLPTGIKSVSNYRFIESAALIEILNKKHVEQNRNIYPTGHGSSELSLNSGTILDPTGNVQPMLRITKFSSADRRIGSKEWDNGVAVLSLEKLSGSAFGAALTAGAFYSDGTGDLVGIHGRAVGISPHSNVFGMWSYAATLVKNTGRVVGHEVNVNNRSSELRWLKEVAVDKAGNGAISGLVVGISDGKYGAHHGVRIRGGGGNQKFWTGIQIAGDSIHSTDREGNGEGIRLEGSTHPNNAYGGIAMGSDAKRSFLTYGLRTSRTTLANGTALWMASGQKVRWGDDLNESSAISINEQSLSMSNVQSMRIDNLSLFELSDDSKSVSVFNGSLKFNEDSIEPRADRKLSLGKEYNRFESVYGSIYFDVRNASGGDLISDGDVIVVKNREDAPGQRNIYLPSNPKVGKSIVIKDGGGKAALSVIRINSRGHSIEGRSFIEINKDFGFVRLVFTSEGWLSI